MSKVNVYKSKRKSERNGIKYWNYTGFTLLVGTYQGKPSVSLIDERTGITHTMFRVEPRTTQAPPTAAPQTAPPQQGFSTPPAGPPAADPATDAFAGQYGEEPDW